MKPSQLVCIVDDDASVRDSLSLMLGLKGFDCRTYDSSEAFLSSPPSRPCCVVLDLNMHEINGLVLHDRIRELSLPVEVIYLTAFADVDAIRRAFLNSAIDFLEKPVLLNQLLPALDRGFAKLAQSQAALQQSHSFEALTPREREVMEAIVKGMTHREVGDLLGISPRTVEVHKGRVMEKMGVKTLADLVRISLANAG